MLYHIGEWVLVAVYSMVCVHCLCWIFRINLHIREHTQEAKETHGILSGYHLIRAADFRTLRLVPLVLCLASAFLLFIQIGDVT